MLIVVPGGEDALERIETYARVMIAAYRQNETDGCENNCRWCGELPEEGRGMIHTADGVYCSTECLIAAL